MRICRYAYIQTAGREIQILTLHGSYKSSPLRTHGRTHKHHTERPKTQQTYHGVTTMDNLVDSCVDTVVQAKHRSTYTYPFLPPLSIYSLSSSSRRGRREDPTVASAGGALAAWRASEQRMLARRARACSWRSRIEPRRSRECIASGSNPWTMPTSFPASFWPTAWREACRRFRMSMQTYGGADRECRRCGQAYETFAIGVCTANAVGR